MPPVATLTFQRAMINLTDAGRLGEGEDLNDALLDFFVKLGQALIPRGGDAAAPVAYLGSMFFKQLRSAGVMSGDEGWQQVKNWAKRKAGGMFKPNYAAFAVPINEDLKDDRGQDAGNHWWLALVLHPPGGALADPTAVMCLDSMQRRKKQLNPPLTSSVEGSMNRYSLEVTEMEQAGYLVIITFDARGDGSMGPLQRPEASTLLVDGYICGNPTLGLRINMPGGNDVAGRFEGTLTFALDGRGRSSAFVFKFGHEGYSPVHLEFDPFNLTKLQKDVSRYLGGYLAKEWEQNGPNKGKRFEKQSVRALVADVHQQENLNDCGVFALENTLRALSMKPDFLRKMAEASPQVLKTFPWPTQQDITARKLKLKAIVAELFADAAEKGTTDVEALMKANEALKMSVLKSLTDEREEELDRWSGQLQKELAARQVDKDKEAAELKRKEEIVQARREEERRRREEDERKAEEERLQGKKPPGMERSSSSDRSASRGRSPTPPPKKKGGKEPAPNGKRGRRDSDSEDAGKKGKKQGQEKKHSSSKGKKRRKSASSSRASSRSPSRSPSRNRRRRY